MIVLEDYTNNGITEKELTSTKNSYLNSASLKYETSNQKIGFLNRILTYDLESSYIKKQSEILNTISLNEVNQIASNKIKKDEMAIVIVGNKYLIKKKLENLTSSSGKKYNFKINEIKF